MKNLLILIGILFMFSSCQKEESVQPKKPSTPSYTYKMVNFVLSPQPGFRTGGMGVIYYSINNANTMLMDYDVWNGVDPYQTTYYSYSCPVGSVVHYTFTPTIVPNSRSPLISISIDNSILFINSTVLQGSFTVN